MIETFAAVLAALLIRDLLRAWLQPVFGEPFTKHPQIEKARYKLRRWMVGRNVKDRAPV